jgi:selenium metabolism protein YedF
MSNEIDARGLACPQPVIATKKALESLGGGSITTIVDNAAAKENVVKFAVANQCGASVEEKQGHYYIKITKGLAAANQAETMAAAPTGQTVYLITKDTLGHGSEELGTVLMKAFLYSLLETDPLPRTLMFLNSGVRLTIDDSPLLDHLKTLAERGVTILSCGTCLDYFALKERLAVGEVTNMYTIVAELGTAAKTITL